MQSLVSPLVAPLVPALIEPTQSAGAAARTGTAAGLYSVVGTHLRTPVGFLNITDAGASTLTRQITQVAVPMPDYSTSEHRIFMPTFWQATSGKEVKVASDVIIEGVAIKIGGTWRRVQTGLPLTIPAGTKGAWVDAIPAGYSAAANEVILVRIYWRLPTLAGNLAFPVGPSKNTTFNGTNLSDSQQADTEANAAVIAALLPADGATTQTALGQANGRWYPPSLIIAKGGDGRKAVVVVGDSIGYGENATPVTNAQTTRGEWGYVNVGLDSASGAKRIAYANLCVPGQNPINWSDRTYWECKADMLKAVRDQYGYWPFDEVWTQHAENSLGGGNLASTIIPYLQLLRTEWGLPIVQLQPLVEATSSDLYATTANQSTSVANTYPTGDRWLFTAACLPGGSLRTGGYIDDSFGVWSYECADPSGNDRDIFAVRPFSTTLAADYNGSNGNVTLSLNAAPPIGVGLQLAGNSSWFSVIGPITGTGPYSVGTSKNGTNATAVLAGAAVQEIPHDTAGVHPTAIMHNSVLPQAVIDFKAARGWV